MKRQEEWRFDRLPKGRVRNKEVAGRPSDSLSWAAENEGFLLATVDATGGIVIVGEDKRLAEANRNIQARMAREKDGNKEETR